MILGSYTDGRPQMYLVDPSGVSWVSI